MMDEILDPVGYLFGIIVLVVIFFAIDKYQELESIRKYKNERDKIF
jgi:hypothetical protein